jgi:hypothetical protein
MRISLMLALLCPLFVVGAIEDARGESAGLFEPQGVATPADQGFGYIVNPPFGAQSTSVGSESGTTLDTMTATNESAGFFTHNPFNGARIHPASPVLDRSAGIGVGFRLALNAETHSTPNRAGFSVIVIASDGRGIEVGFWTNEIWVYDDDRDGAANLFKHAEGVAQSPAAMTTMRKYDLVMLADRYALSIDGVAVLSGRVRDYGNFVGPTFPLVGELDPYEAANIIFFGDDTSSAASRSVLGSVAVTTLGADGITIIDSGISDGRFSMSWESLPGVRYGVSASTNLVDWVSVQQSMATGNGASFSAPLAADARSFYRIESEGIPE